MSAKPVSRSNRGVRRRLAPILATIGVFALLAGLTIGYMERVLFDSDQFAARAAATLESDAVKDEIAVLITDEVVISAEADLVAFRPLIEGVTGQVVGSSAFRSLFRSTVADLHRAVFSHDEHTITLTVINLGIVVRTALERVAPEAAERIPADLNLIQSEPSEALLGLVQLAEDTRFLAIVLMVVALLSLGAALALSHDRREGIRRTAIAIALSAGLILVGYWVLHSRLVGTIDDPGVRAAADGIWSAYLTDFRDLFLVVTGTAAVVAAAAAALLRPIGLERPLLTLWQRLARRPERTWIRVARAFAFILVGGLIVADTDTALTLLALTGGIGLIYLGTQELLRLLVKPVAEAEAGQPTRRRLVSRNTLLVSGTCAAAMVIGGSLFIASGGVSQVDIELPGCNGHIELCDRTLPEVTFPATHNSFSAADQPDWLFAQHEAGIAAQLAGGVRGFLIDTHWGRETGDGSVITDLSDDGNKSRQEYVEEFGEEAFDAALRVRDSLGGSSEPPGPPRIYLCHGFCEVGARLLSDDLEAMRDFLLANPHQVLVVIVQNEGVGPEDFAAAVEDSGLDRFVYRGSVAEWPTLAEMIRDNQRVVFMSEKPPFGVVPWNHEAYAITQETPYKFERPAQLTDPEKLPASCVENRGPADAQLFLLNHWIDSSPAPRPSNARIVNAHEPLLHRARECERLRGRKVNLVAVDFWRSGDLFTVVDELNGLER